MMNRRREMLLKKSGGGDLPSGYKKCEYIKGKSNPSTKDTSQLAFIDTNVELTVNTKMEIKCAIDQKDTSNKYCGMVGAGASVWFVAGYYSSLGLYSAFCTTFGNGCKKPNDNLPHIIYVSNDTQRIDDNETNYTVSQFDIINDDSNAWNIPYNHITLFEGNMRYSRPSSKNSMSIYYCKIWDGDELIRDYIPCLDDNNKPCLYDKVNQIPYYSGGIEFDYELE